MHKNLSKQCVKSVIELPILANDGVEMSYILIIRTSALLAICKLSHGWLHWKIENKTEQSKSGTRYILHERNGAVLTLFQT